MGETEFKKLGKDGKLFKADVTTGEARHTLYTYLSNSKLNHSFNVVSMPRCVYEPGPWAGPGQC